MLWKDSLAAPCRGWERASLAPKGRLVPCWDLGFGGATLGPAPRPPPRASGRLSPGAACSLTPCFSAGGIFSNLYRGFATKRVSSRFCRADSSPARSVGRALGAVEGAGPPHRPDFTPLLLPSLQQVHLIVDQALKRYSEDRVGMVDYALESAGRWRGTGSGGAVLWGAGAQLTPPFPSPC